MQHTPDQHRPTPTTTALPRNPEAERAVIATIALHPGAFSEVKDLLSEESFFAPENRAIYAACRDIDTAGDTITLPTLYAALMQRNELDLAGGPAGIAGLSSCKDADPLSLRTHAMIVKQDYVRRQLQSWVDRLTACNMDASIDVADILDQAQQGINQITSTAYARPIATLSDLSRAALKSIEDAASRPEGVTGVPTGFAGLDRLTAGWQPTDLIIIGGRPGMGKTAIGMSLAINAIKAGVPVGFFSAEMSADQLVKRVLAAESMIPSNVLRTGRLEQSGASWSQLTGAVAGLQGIAPMWIDDTPGITMPELSGKATRMVRQHGCKMIVIDYIGLITSGSKRYPNRQEEVQAISKSLKILAKELQVPVIVLAQLNRGVEQRGGDKRPQLSDLRESGSIEQDADVVCFVHRPEYYAINGIDAAGNNVKGIAELIVAKHRNGALDTINLRYISELTKFTDPLACGPDLGVNAFAAANPRIAQALTPTAPAGEKAPF